MSGHSCGKETGKRAEEVVPSFRVSCFARGANVAGVAVAGVLVDYRGCLCVVWVVSWRLWLLGATVRVAGLVCSAV